MGYHSATCTQLETKGISRLKFDIVTVYHAGSAPSVSEAYANASESFRVLRWTSNDSVIPKDITEAIGWAYQGAMNIARERQTAATIAQYCESQANRTPEQIAEENFEMRAAFGEGTEVVNILTGKRTQL